MRPRAIVAVTVGTLFFFVCLLVLARGFPAEDALILFKYSENVARGYGIVYFPGGPHAEGATDFLWMLGLAGARWAGVDVGVAAALSNAVGAAACAFMFQARGTRVRATVGVLIAWLLLSPPAAAGYVGFGTMPFSALALAMMLTTLEGGSLAVIRLPFIALVSALVRPDGAILGAGYAILGLVRANRLGVRRAYVVRAVVALALGAAYFLARARYFGEWLPLPMYVKRHTDGLSGIALTLDWVVAVVPSVLAIAVFAWLGRVRREVLVAWGVAMAPLLLHVLSFAGAVQTQNVANRFQAPATVALACCAARFAAELPALQRPWRGIALAAALWTWIPGALAVRRIGEEALRGDYLEALAPALPRGSTMKLATTEAGNLAFWNDGAVLDLVGLNSPETARVPPGRELLDRFAPDLVLLHPADGLDMEELAAAHPEATKAIVRLEEPIGPYVIAARRRFYADGLPAYRDLGRGENVKVAPIAVFAYLDERPYDVYLVPSRTRGGIHVVALRRGWQSGNEVLRTIVAISAEGRRLPYLATRVRTVAARKM